MPDRVSMGSPQSSRKWMFTALAMICYLLGVGIARRASDEMAHNEWLVSVGLEDRVELLPVYVLSAVAVLLLIGATVILLYRDRWAGRMSRVEAFRDRAPPSEVSAMPREWADKRPGPTSEPGASTSVKRVCHRCGTHNPSFAEYCVGCSTPLKKRSR